MTATYPGMSDDPIQDSKNIRRRELTPIVERLKSVLAELEEYAQMRPADYDDNGHHGD
jgi:hypothetical protein